MLKKTLFFTVFVLGASFVYAQEPLKEAAVSSEKAATIATTAAIKSEEAVSQEALPKDKILAIATAAVKGEGVKLDEVNIIYDEGGQLWSERLGKAVGVDNSPNHGILKKGFLKNYKIVYFDFKEPINDIWVFVDKDTGEVLEVYREP